MPGTISEKSLDVTDDELNLSLQEERFQVTE